jgi:hypothetical protein
MPITHSAREKYYEDQARIKEHLPRIKALHKPNVKRYAALHNLPYQRLRHALQGKHDRTSRTQAHWLLSDHQDLALEQYCDAVNEIGFGITKNLGETQANTLLEESFLVLRRPQGLVNTGQAGGWRAIPGTKGLKLRLWRWHGSWLSNQMVSSTGFLS